jgi:hypothetical protein
MKTLISLFTGIFTFFTLLASAFTPLLNFLLSTVPLYKYKYLGLYSFSYQVLVVIGIITVSVIVGRSLGQLFDFIYYDILKK